MPAGLIEYAVLSKQCQHIAYLVLLYLIKSV